MDRTSFGFRRSPHLEPAPLRRAQPVGAPRTREPIYAQLVAEWRAEGRTVPAAAELKWAFRIGLPARTGPEAKRP
ncbi:hypothetical protein ACIPSA_38780 [Streptomyces sp. NPDC086549]|uniref:hypothetical protein n=1 Tax=Streptomyces sp. NPDC086549 TaxID=3365752 RepID=UPI00381A81EB